MVYYKLTEEDRKFLTEKVLNECWHEIVERYDLVMAVCSCGAHDTATFILRHIEEHNRTFTTPQDQKDLMRVIKRKGKWNEFVFYAHEQWLKSLGRITTDEWMFFYWLQDEEERFCKLAADFWRMIG